MTMKLHGVGAFTTSSLSAAVGARAAWRAHAAVAALAALAWFPPSAAAQAQAQEAEFDSWRMPGWSFTPSITLGTVRDSNIALAGAPAADDGSTADDALFIMEPSGRLEYFSPRMQFGAGYSGYVRRYRNTEQLNGFDQRVHVSLRRLATKRLTFFLRDSFADVPTTDEVELNGVPFSRTGARTNTLTGGVESSLTKFTSLRARYDSTWVDFERTANTFLTGGWLNGVMVDLSHRINERTTLGGEYSFRVADLNEGTRELRFQDVGGTARYELGPQTTFSAGAGLSFLVDKLDEDNRTGPYVRVGITHRGQRATVGAGYQRMFVPTFGFGGSSQSQEIGGYIRMPLPKNRVYVQGSLTWRRTDPFIENELELDTLWLRSTVGYALARWLRGEGFYSYTRQDSIITGGEIDRHRIGAQVVISQPMRIR